MRYSNYTGKGNGSEPLKTAPEMAEALGITVRAMVLYMSKNSGPGHALQFSGTQRAMQRTYYTPSVVKKWWRVLLETRPDLVVKHGL